VADPAVQLEDALRDRYVIERELGRGGMATVYLAHDLRRGRPVTGAPAKSARSPLSPQSSHPMMVPTTQCLSTQTQGCNAGSPAMSARISSVVKPCPPAAN
jgi:serine/threonine protein kinase